MPHPAGCQGGGGGTARAGAHPCPTMRELQSPTPSHERETSRRVARRTPRSCEPTQCVGSGHERTGRPCQASLGARAHRALKGFGSAHAVWAGGVCMPQTEGSAGRGRPFQPRPRARALPAKMVRLAVWAHCPWLSSSFFESVKCSPPVHVSLPQERQRSVAYPAKKPTRMRVKDHAPGHEMRHKMVQGRASKFRPRRRIRDPQHVSPATPRPV